ncbi:putative disease resistance protein RGA3 [Carex rostrata]
MVAEAALLTSLGWVASPLIKTLFDKAHHNLGTGIDEKRKILEATVLPRLSLAIEKAEKSPNKEKVVEWLKRLKGAYYEAEEAIDIFEYKKLKQKVKDERGTRISFPCQFVPRKIKDKLSVFTPQKIMLKRCIDNLIKYADEAKDFRDLLGGPENTNGSDAERETYSNPPVRVFGREIDKEKIVSLLTQKPSNSEPGPSTRPAFPIIAITGRSGAGKTALAQYVYEHMDRQQHFNLRVWVYVPRKFKATDVIKNMVEIIKAKEGASNNYPFTSLEALSTELRCMLGSKKLLLVLDDFWSDTEDFDDQWDKFIGTLSSCSPETRILLTTQSNNVSQLAMKVEVYVLKDLEDGQFSELFMHHAWPSNSHLQKEEFEKVGKKIAVKLKGDPGAGKLVGRQLREKLDLRHWEEVAEKDWLEDDMMMKARIWSYQQLSESPTLFCNM